MFLFLSFVVALVSLYYIGVMVDSYHADTTYLTPLVILMIYSILSIVRELKKDTLSWLTGDYGYDTDYYPYRNNQYYNGYNNRRFLDSHSTVIKKPTEDVEYFLPNKKKEKDNEKELLHYPSNNEVREKIKELEKSRLFRAKRSFAGFFGIDITEKYYEPYKINDKGKITPIKNDNKEDHDRFKPKNDWWVNREYNEVAKLMGGRSCEISMLDTEAENNNEQ